MKVYEVKVTETITKFVTVEADSWEEAEEMAYDTDMDSNFDDYSLDVVMISEEEMEIE